MSEEMPVLPKCYGTIDVYHEDGTVSYVEGWTADQVRGYAIDYGIKLGRAAIAASSQQAAPKAALTDGDILEQWEITRDKGGYSSMMFVTDTAIIAYARAIEAAAGPNAALVAALKKISRNEAFVFDHDLSAFVLTSMTDDEMIEVARVALAAAGVKP